MKNLNTITIKLKMIYTFQDHFIMVVYNIMLLHEAVSCRNKLLSKKEISHLERRTRTQTGQKEHPGCYKILGQI